MSSVRVLLIPAPFHPSFVLLYVIILPVILSDQSNLKRLLSPAILWVLLSKEFVFVNFYKNFAVGFFVAKFLQKIRRRNSLRLMLEEEAFFLEVFSPM